MIKSEKGNVHIEGPGLLVEAEFCALIHVMKGIKGEEKTKHLIELALMSDDEMDKKTKEMEEEIAMSFGKAFTEHLDKAFESFAKERIK